MEMILKIIGAVFVYLLCVLELIRLHDKYTDWMSEDDFSYDNKNKEKDEEGD